jgi:hypothetical protein
VSAEFVDCDAVNFHRDRLLALNHPMLARIVYIQPVDDFLVFDSMVPTDTNLDEFLRQARMPGLARSVLVIALAGGLQYLHTNGFRHGDHGQIYLTQRLEP